MSDENQSTEPAPAAEIIAEVAAPIVAPPPVKTVEQLRAEVLAKAKTESLAKAKAAQDAIDNRVAELKAHVGKYFAPKAGGLTYSKVLDYGGIGTLNGGIQAHLFKVEQWNPGLTWTPPASKFLSDNVEIQAPSNETKEIQ